MITLKLEPTHIRLADIQQIIAGPTKIELPDEAWRASERSRAHVQDALSSDVVAYGVNTGFGKLAQNRIDSGQLSTLQQNLVRSHAAGVGQPLRPGVVRLALCLKVISLAQGYSGVTRSEEHTSELQSQAYLVCRLLLEKKNKKQKTHKKKKKKVPPVD